MQFSTEKYLHHFRLISSEEMSKTIASDSFMECWAQADSLDQFIDTLKQNIEQMFTRHGYILKYILHNGRNFTAYFSRL